MIVCEPSFLNPPVLGTGVSGFAEEGVMVAAGAEEANPAVKPIRANSLASRKRSRSRLRSISPDSPRAAFASALTCNLRLTCWWSYELVCCHTS